MYPRTWGQGAIFAPSALDTTVTLRDSLVGTLCGDCLGIVFHTGRRRLLYFRHESRIRRILHRLVGSDVLITDLYDNHGDRSTLQLAYLNQHTLVGTCSPGCRAIMASTLGVAPETGSVVVDEADGDHMALVYAEGGKFALSHNRASAEAAVHGARLGLIADVEAVVATHAYFFDCLPTPSASELAEAVSAAFGVLKANILSPEGLIKHRWTTPDRIPHRYMWLWDSAFHALGLRHLSPELAADAILAVLDCQAPDGFIPHMATPERISRITQPPVLAWALWQVFALGQCTDHLAEAYPKLQAYLKWNDANRDHNRNNLYEWYVNQNSQYRSNRCDESGMDNSIRFDNAVPMENIDFSCYMAAEARHMAKIAAVLGKQSDVSYWQQRFATIAAVVNRDLWHEHDQLYYDRQFDGTLRRVPSVASFLPLFAGICTKRQAAALAAHLDNPDTFAALHPIPSISLSQDNYAPDMWRGPVWLNMTYLVIQGLCHYGYSCLAEEIREKSLRQVAFWYRNDGCFYEYYDPYGELSPRRLHRKGELSQPDDFMRQSNSIRNYGWTCALFADMALAGSTGLNH